jgi:general secretion pathway protein A
MALRAGESLHSTNATNIKATVRAGGEYMYRRFYGLREPPFELTSDPKFLYMTARQREALSNLEYGLSAPKPLTLLIGEAGTGKTTLLRAALASDRCRAVHCVYVNNPALTREEFLATLATGFNLGASAAQSKAILLQELERVLHERRASGQSMALVIDEAQSLSRELLEEVRLLGNIETPTDRLLSLVLAGQPELGLRLEEPGLRQLKQRVVLRCETAALDLRETAAYIASRIQVAGGVPATLFTQDAVTIIHASSRGIPRTINVMCDNALVSGMALNRQPVDRAIILEVCRDFALRVNGDAVPLPVLNDADGSDVAVRPAVAPPAEAHHGIGSRYEPVAVRPRRFTLFGSGR